MLSYILNDIDLTEPQDPLLFADPRHSIQNYNLCVIQGLHADFLEILCILIHLSFIQYNGMPIMTHNQIMDFHNSGLLEDADIQSVSDRHDWQHSLDESTPSRTSREVQEKFIELLNRCFHLNPTKPRMRLIFLGNVMGGRGPTDFGTVCLFNWMNQHGIDFRIIFGEHEMQLYRSNAFSHYPDPKIFIDAAYEQWQEKSGSDIDALEKFQAADSSLNEKLSTQREHYAQEKYRTKMDQMGYTDRRSVSLGDIDAHFLSSSPHASSSSASSSSPQSSSSSSSGLTAANLARLHNSHDQRLQTEAAYLQQEMTRLSQKVRSSKPAHFYRHDSAGEEIPVSINDAQKKYQSFDFFSMRGTPDFRSFLLQHYEQYLRHVRLFDVYYENGIPILLTHFSIGLHAFSNVFTEYILSNREKNLREFFDLRQKQFFLPKIQAFHEAFTMFLQTMHRPARQLTEPLPPFIEAMDNAFFKPTRSAHYSSIFNSEAKFYTTTQITQNMKELQTGTTEQRSGLAWYLLGYHVFNTKRWTTHRYPSEIELGDSSIDENYIDSPRFSYLFIKADSLDL